MIITLTTQLAGVVHRCPKFGVPHKQVALGVRERSLYTAPTLPRRTLLGGVVEGSALRMGRACAWTLCASVVYAGISLACARRVVPSAEIFSRSVDSIADEVKMETVPEPGPRLLKHTFISPKPAV